ncbi:matrixin family metalloprotease [Halobellus marinus]|uniref:matrixin family metalloprotease n=1 Tax=Halobellus TaxID=1073986 RepID=UPI0028A7E7FD|nr:matrixin family metalloprotease [Halobellus sp. DFY28]
MSTRLSRAVPLALAVLILLAGCAGPVVDLPETEPTPAADATGTEQSSSIAEATTESTQRTDREPTPTPTAVPQSKNPWGSEPIVVAVEDTAGTGREWTPLVREATAYWEEKAERFAGFPVEYEVDPDATNPDLVVEFVDEVPECDGAADAAGCAPLIDDSREIDRPETVFVRTDFSDDSTVLVAEHELGHTLGLTHEDAPQDVMASRSVLYTEPLPNATERAFPWDDGDFTVYIDDDNASDPDGFRKQVTHALEYYEDDPPGMPTNLTFTTVDEPDDAEIVVRPAETSPCGEGAASCGGTIGWDPDGDGAIETYSELRVSLVDLDTDAVGWHVGYWLAYGFGAEDDDEKPPPFRDASYEERRSEWWEE